jgi:hypothetical protein
VNDAMTVSTVLVRDGRERFYETTIIVSGVALEGRRQAKKIDAGYEHDAAIAFARGHRDEWSIRTMHWTRALVDVVAA